MPRTHTHKRTHREQKKKKKKIRLHRQRRCWRYSNAARSMATAQRASQPPDRAAPKQRQQQRHRRQQQRAVAVNIDPNSIWNGGSLEPTMGSKKRAKNCV